MQDIEYQNYIMSLYTQTYMRNLQSHKVSISMHTESLISAIKMTFMLFIIHSINENCSRSTYPCHRKYRKIFIISQDITFKQTISIFIYVHNMLFKFQQNRLYITVNNCIVSFSYCFYNPFISFAHSQFLSNPITHALESQSH